ncbi:hypothetical protein C8J56DRAFT_936088 [Mycena floridula]|nr:hypothetical protein C8J56DRAFT_936088 [Mycena floridula]
MSSSRATNTGEHKIGKGKKRAIEDITERVDPEAPPVVLKKSKRAETRECPICSEHIPLRLLGKHAELESHRVDVIISNVGSTEVIQDEFEEGSSTSNRRSAVKARKTIGLVPESSSLAQTMKTVATIKRNRKQRNSKLRDMTKEDEEGYTVCHSRRRGGRGEILCPVCRTSVRGDDDVLDAHLEACLADEIRKHEDERAREMERFRVENELIVNEDENWADLEHIGHIGNVEGTGFHTRNSNEQDVDEEIDIDGDDSILFGDAQFTERDILGQAEDVDVEEDGERTLRGLISDGEAIKEEKTPKEVKDDLLTMNEIDLLNLSILAAKRAKDHGMLVLALENKIKHLESTQTTGLLCRICIDPYIEPSVSTGCWHALCKDCWLRCLGSTKLCPICKRITAATDLRRVYL